MTHAIETHDLTRAFGDVVAVDRLSLTVPEGEVFGFLGPNGAGKTTTIRMLLGLIRPDEGQVHLLGQSLEHHRRALLGQVGALVEMPSLYPHLTGRENLDVTRRLVGIGPERIDQVLATVGLMDAAHRPVRGFSLGMRQRLGLALALLPEPKLLILDEPTNGLDPAGIREMRDLIRRLPSESGTTVLLSSHLLAEVEQVASRVAIVAQGRLCFEGTCAELARRQHPTLQIGVQRASEAASFLIARGFAATVAAEDGPDRLAVADFAERDAAALNTLLVANGFTVHHLALHRPTLEDVFLQLTQRHEHPG